MRGTANEIWISDSVKQRRSERERHAKTPISPVAQTRASQRLAGGPAVTHTDPVLRRTLSRERFHVRRVADLERQRVERAAAQARAVRLRQRAFRAERAHAMAQRQARNLDSALATTPTALGGSAGGAWRAAADSPRRRTDRAASPPANAAPGFYRALAQPTSPAHVRELSVATAAAADAGAAARSTSAHSPHAGSRPGSPHRRTASARPRPRGAGSAPPAPAHIPKDRRYYRRRGNVWSDLAHTPLERIPLTVRPEMVERDAAFVARVRARMEAEQATARGEAYARRLRAHAQREAFKARTARVRSAHQRLMRGASFRPDSAASRDDPWETLRVGEAPPPPPDAQVDALHRSETARAEAALRRAAAGAARTRLDPTANPRAPAGPSPPPSPARARPRAASAPADDAELLHAATARTDRARSAAATRAGLQRRASSPPLGTSLVARGGDDDYGDVDGAGEDGGSDGASPRLAAPALALARPTRPASAAAGRRPRGGRSPPSPRRVGVVLRERSERRAGAGAGSGSDGDSGSVPDASTAGGAWGGGATAARQGTGRRSSARPRSSLRPGSALSARVEELARPKGQPTITAKVVLASEEVAGLLTADPDLGDAMRAVRSAGRHAQRSQRASVRVSGPSEAERVAAASRAAHRAEVATVERIAHTLGLPAGASARRAQWPTDAPAAGPHARRTSTDPHAHAPLQPLHMADQTAASPPGWRHAAPSPLHAAARDHDPGPDRGFGTRIVPPRLPRRPAEADAALDDLAAFEERLATVGEAPSDPQWIADVAPPSA